MSEDITYCTARCKNKPNCERNPKLIKQMWMPHSFSNFKNVCSEYKPKEVDNSDCQWK